MPKKLGTDIHGMPFMLILYRQTVVAKDQQAPLPPAAVSETTERLPRCLPTASAVSSSCLTTIRIVPQPPIAILHNSLVFYDMANLLDVTEAYLSCGSSKRCLSCKRLIPRIRVFSRFGLRLYT